MAESQNGYPVFFDVRTDGPFPRLRLWRIPGTDMTFLLRDGSTGFLLVHLVTWLHESIDVIDVPFCYDDHGYGLRQIAGTSVWSNHSSGTAVDVDAIEHPQGKVGTFAFMVNGVLASTRIRLRLARLFQGSVRWGGDFRSVVDEMHFEIDVELPEAERVARSLMETPIGRRVLTANPGAKEVILL